MPEQPSTPPHLSGLARIRALMRNPISIIGLAVAVVALGNILFLFFIDMTSPHPSPYIGILAYMVAPAFLVLGLALVLFGAFYYRHQRLSSAGASTHLRFDFSDPAQRGAISFFLVFIIIFVGMSVVGSYKAYNFTDSIGFCGQLCHSVMAPEFTAYQQSPHARVACVDCHVGAGATWYVKSKLSGARQVVKTALNTFPRPIPTPVHNLRPRPKPAKPATGRRSSTARSSKSLTTSPATSTTRLARFAFSSRPEAAIPPPASPPVSTGT